MATSVIKFDFSNTKVTKPENTTALVGVDLNNYKLTGIYKGYNATNSPSSLSGIFVLIVCIYSADWLVQFYVDIGTGDAFTRTFKSGTTWLAWQKVTQTAT